MPLVTLGKGQSLGLLRGQVEPLEEEAPLQLWFLWLRKAGKDPRFVKALSWKGILGGGTACAKVERQDCR